jgi:type II secretory pathway component PulJ
MHFAGMPHRTGFSVVEAIVATTMLGVVGAMLAGTFSVVRAARARAEARGASALVVAERVATLARRPCTAADTAGGDRLGRAISRWAANRSGAAWAFADSTTAPGSGPPVVIAGQVPCPR